MQGRLEEQLPSLWMASVGGCGKTTSGLPPITVSLHDSRSLHRSIRCVLDGVSEHSRTLWGDRAHLPLCRLETQLPAMPHFEASGCSLLPLPQAMSAALVRTTTAPFQVSTAAAFSQKGLWREKSHFNAHLLTQFIWPWDSFLLA